MATAGSCISRHVSIDMYFISINKYFFKWVFLKINLKKILHTCTTNSRRLLLFSLHTKKSCLLKLLFSGFYFNKKLLPEIQYPELPAV